MSGLKSLRKGKLGERTFRALCEEYNLDCINQSEDKNKPDVRIETIDCEVKYSAKSVPLKLYQWFCEKNANMLAIRRVSKKEPNLPWLLVIPANMGLEILRDFFRKGGKIKDEKQTEEMENTFSMEDTKDNLYREKKLKVANQNNQNKTMKTILQDEELEMIDDDGTEEAIEPEEEAV